MIQRKVDVGAKWSEADEILLAGARFDLGATHVHGLPTVPVSLVLVVRGIRAGAVRALPDAVCASCALAVAFWLRVCVAPPACSLAFLFGAFACHCARAQTRRRRCTSRSRAPWKLCSRRWWSSKR